MKRKQGITLIALIITIIILLILVGVSVNLLIKGDLFGSAERAVKGTNAKTEEQQTRVDELMENLSQAEEEVKAQSEAIAGRRTNKKVPYYSNGKTAVIPAGFTVSGIKDEQSIDEGLVIYDIPEGTTVDWKETTTVGTETYLKVQCDYNQFVWVPVETPVVTASELNALIDDETKTDVTNEQTAINYIITNEGKYPMAIEYQINGKTNYKGVLYDFKAGTSKVEITAKEFSTTDDYNSVDYFREPLTIINGGYTDRTQEQNLDMQTEYNNIVKNIKENKGFWVARYEVSYNNKGESKRGKTVASSSDSKTKQWYGLYNACKSAYQTSNKVKSYMVATSQWDQILIWMKDVKNTSDNSKYYIVDSSYMGNYTVETGGTGEPQVCGYKDNYAVKKIFDLGGNFAEFTTGVMLSEYRVLRGLMYINNGTERPASFYHFYYANGEVDYYSSRFTLCII